MPVYGIIVNKRVANAINADDESVALPIARSIASDAFVVELDNTSGGIGWFWDGAKLVPENPEEQLIAQQGENTDANI